MALRNHLRRAGIVVADGHRQAMRKQLRFEVLESRRLLAISANAGFEWGTFADWGASAGVDANIYGSGGLHHEGAGNMSPSSGHYFGAITAPRNSPAGRSGNLDLFVAANQGDLVIGNYFLMVGANAQGAGARPS